MLKSKNNDSREMELQYELLKVISEYNHEDIFEYDVDEDLGAVYEVQDGEFCPKMQVANFKDNFYTILKGSPEEDIAECRRLFDKCLESPSNGKADFRYKNKDGDLNWYRCFMVSCLNEEGRIERLTGRITSVHKEKMANEMIRHMAEIDALTGVYNHKTFETVAAETIANEKTELFFLMLDVDDFKIVNDSLGHNVGDMVLSETGKTLHKMVEGRGIAGRLGGDEFALVAWNFKDRDDIISFCNKLRKRLKNIIFDMEYSASIGACIRYGRDMTFQDMYYEADQAVYKAKKNGKNQIVFYDELAQKDKEKVEKVEDVSFEDEFENLVPGDKYQKFIVDERLEYIIIIDAETLKITYVNRPALKMFEGYSENWRDMYCYNLFQQSDELSNYLENETDQYFKMNSMIDSSVEYLVHSFSVIWQDKEAKILSIIDITDKEHVNAVMQRRGENLYAIKSCLTCVAGNSVQDGHKGALKLLNEFYSADCAALVQYEEGRYNKAEIVHKPNAEVVAKLLKSLVESENLTKYQDFLDGRGNILLEKVSDLKEKSPDLYKSLADSRVWSVLGKLVNWKGENVGALILLNTRRNNGENDVMDIIGGYLATEVVRNKMELRQEYEEKHDKLTGLWNRESFTNWTELWNESNWDSLGIFAVDIIFLKNINRDFGYKIGDKNLKNVAEIIDEVFSGYRTYRYDADEIVAFCPDISQDAFERLCQCAMESMDDLEFDVACGYSWSKNVEVRRQINEAEEMIIRDKDSQINRHDSIRKTSQRVKNEIEEELAGGRFKVFLQPKVDINTGQTVGAEALIRLLKEDIGIVSPTEFITVLEKHDAVHLIDIFVFDEVCATISRRLKRGLQVVPVSVNFSKRTLLYTGLMECINRIMDRYDIPRELVQIEITETMGDLDNIVVREVVAALKSMGFELAMDDFGTKYSNIEMLFRYQFDVAKIDRSLVREITTNEKSLVVLKHLVSMISDLGIKLVIEGVESKEQIRILKQINCDVVQGFYYSKPIPADEFYREFVD